MSPVKVISLQCIQTSFIKLLNSGPDIHVHVFFRYVISLWTLYPCFTVLINMSPLVYFVVDRKWNHILSEFIFHKKQSVIQFGIKKKTLVNSKSLFLKIISSKIINIHTSNSVTHKFCTIIHMHYQRLNNF